jgi:hypothetical protein
MLNNNTFYDDLTSISSHFGNDDDLKWNYSEKLRKGRQGKYMYNKFPII